METWCSLPLLPHQPFAEILISAVPAVRGDHVSFRIEELFGTIVILVTTGWIVIVQRSARSQMRTYQH